MAYEHNEGRGTMFKNTRKENEKHPEYRGSVKVDGVTYDIAFWWSKTNDGELKKDKDGNPIMSLKVSHQRGEEQRPTPKDDPLDGDGINF